MLEKGLKQLLLYAIMVPPVDSRAIVNITAETYLLLLLSISPYFLFLPQETSSTGTLYFRRVITVQQTFVSICFPGRHAVLGSDVGLGHVI